MSADGLQTPLPSGNALDDPRMQEICRSLRVRLWIRLALIVLIAVAAGLLIALGVGPVGFAPVLVWIICLVMLQVVIANFRWLRRIERVLRVYPWEKRPGVHRLDVNERRPRSPHVVKISHGSGRWSPELVMSPVIRHRTWEEDMASGIWFAGDERFGGIVAIPGGQAPMFSKPRQWEQLASRRAKADADALDRAQRAGIDRKKW
ncbi:hypothetical protein ACIBW9_30195 [Streptomyces sp. NPDC049541]|uniref:hypothetical protein n=1 Tax=Streptomyces sp. NPDC049541 TaxID=3365594 RepID=UPI0037A4EB77